MTKCGVLAGNGFTASVCSSSNSSLPVGSATNSKALFKTFQLTAGNLKEPPQSTYLCPKPALLQGWTCWKREGDPLTNSLRAQEHS